MKPRQANIVLKCGCGYRTNNYHNPLKAKVMILKHLIREHGGSLLNVQLNRVEEQLDKSKETSNGSVNPSNH